LDEQKRCQRHRPPYRRLGTAQKALDERRNQPQSMDGDHNRIVAGPALDRPASPKPPLVPPRVKELQQALEPDKHHADYEQYDVQSPSRPITKS
jgi:hypothetical protein